MSPSKKKLLAAAKAQASLNQNISHDLNKEKAVAPPQVDEATIQARAAAARAYAFGSNDNDKTTTKKTTRIKSTLKSFATPLARPSPSSNHVAKKSSTTKRKKSPSPGVRRKIPPTQEENQDELDDYARFVQSLDADLLSLAPLEDEEDEYKMMDEEEFTDDEEDVIHELNQIAASSPPMSPLSLLKDDSTTSDDWQGSLYMELEAELGGLLEEDLEAALHVLGNGNQSPTPKAQAPPLAAHSPPCTPLRSSRSSSKSTVTTVQRRRLAKLMDHHYQLLAQQALLAVRAAHQQKQANPTKPDGGESADDLAEILDGAVQMLQDLNQNRKDAIRNSIQLPEKPASPKKGGKRSLLPMLDSAAAERNGTTPSGERRLTRSAFTKTLLTTHKNATSFDVKGLASLQQTFDAIDKSVSGQSRILDLELGQACTCLLQQAGANTDEALLPGAKDLSLHLSRPKEVFGQDFLPPMTEEQETMLRKNRNQFTAAEDNLVLRGVNLYGEKQWLLIADRYLPDRSVNIISQRYSKLCLLLYKAHGVVVDAEGNLETPPKNKSHDTLDEEALSKLKRAEPPAILNVHRWSLEEDLTLLKAVPLLGNMWAELSTRFIPHRDRGHLRKRYQVLERRVKATVQRSKRSGDAPKPTCAPSAPTKRTSTLVSKPPGARRKSSKVGKGVLPRALPHPGAPPYMGRVVEAAPRLKRMPNGLVPLTGAPVVQRPAFQLAARGHAMPNVGTANHSSFAGIIKGRNGNKQTVRGNGQDKSKYDSLPAACSPELDVASGTTESSSRNDTRTGFEKLLEEGTNDWSQMPRIKKMMENDPESMVASAIVSHLASAGKDMASDKGAALEKLPQIDVDSTTSSGLSMLNTTTRDGGDGNGISSCSPCKAPKNASIMARVLERTTKKADRPKPDNGGPHEDRPESDDATPLIVPSTPSRPSLFAVPTTPIGLSPGLKSGFLSPAGFRSGFTPTGKTGFTPTGSSIVWNAPTGTSTDGYEVLNFEISDRSRQAFESNGPKPMGSNFGHPLTPCAAGLFPDGPHSLMANDFEAISALNSLSNSPARSLLMKRPSSEIASTCEGNNKNGGEKPSFFAKAIGGIHDKESKKSRVE